MSEPTLEIHLAPEQLLGSLREDALIGLTSTPKWLPPKWFYDARGSELFEEITRLPEYFPTRTERELLRASAADIAEATSAQILVELGSGSSEKTRLLLGAMTEHGTLERYVPQDVSEAALVSAVGQLADEFPSLTVHGIVSDFTDTLHNLPRGGTRMIAFLGGTLGNLVPDERAEFLASIAEVLDEGEQLLLGVGLVTDPAVLVPAYDDAAGVTAQFNRNVLSVLNEQLGADFDVDRFRHVALWDETNEWIEMRLEAAEAMSVCLPGIGLDVRFGAGEQMRTEISAKFRVEGIGKELDAAGFGSDRVWTDPDERFALILADKK
ncbi:MULTISPECIES: L-histidine N(alpha)-methyltransferase [Rhodococcus]|uniref:Histidine N-alpha-methyltransferase n=1 Tax=Rhodococcus maanshanensis TaxID=183556 RepID=A0A1H7MKZ5_9NOCA|nr:MULTISPECIES: L-histidine N(alpha)-methyltransferase [Rhodococcus]SEL11297.1 L-histidine Nalpha-methyltransferase [Rhodococcus maanshanensis]